MTPRTAEQNLQIKDETREKILSGALQVFSRRGYAATRIGDIAKACGVSHGLLYYYFKSKDEIFTELAENAINSSAQALQMTEALDLPIMEKIKWITEEILKYISSDTDSAYYFLLMAQISVTDSLPEGVTNLLKGPSVPFVVLTRMLTEGQQQGTIAAGDVTKLVVAYWAAIQGLAIYQIAYGDQFPIPDAEILMRMFYSLS
jgi:AcrR family transcriptional regulator